MANTLYWTHIAFGFVAFLVGPVALASAKGGTTHRRWGKVYFWSMVVVASTALFLSLYRPNYFLAFVSVFSFYLAFRGYRALKRNPSREQRGPTRVDYTGLILALVASVALVVLGILRPAPVWVALGPSPLCLELWVYSSRSSIFLSSCFRQRIDLSGGTRTWPA
jgi:uncharacterized membrane protein